MQLSDTTPSTISCLPMHISDLAAGGDEDISLPMQMQTYANALVAVNPGHKTTHVVCGQ